MVETYNQSKTPRPGHRGTHTNHVEKHFLFSLGVYTYGSVPIGIFHSSTVIQSCINWHCTQIFLAWCAGPTVH
eukprot:14044310-Ditylum_brightwellii.AAC.1